MKGYTMTIKGGDPKVKGKKPAKNVRKSKAYMADKKDSKKGNKAGEAANYRFSKKKMVTKGKDYKSIVEKSLSSEEKKYGKPRNTVTVKLKDERTTSQEKVSPSGLTIRPLSEKQKRKAGRTKSPSLLNQKPRRAN